MNLRIWDKKMNKNKDKAQHLRIKIMKIKRARTLTW